MKAENSLRKTRGAHDDTGVAVEGRATRRQKAVARSAPRTAALYDGR
jgi:hypothetical protein